MVKVEYQICPLSKSVHPRGTSASPISTRNIPPFVCFASKTLFTENMSTDPKGSSEAAVAKMGISRIVKAEVETVAFRRDVVLSVINLVSIKVSFTPSRLQPAVRVSILGDVFSKPFTILQKSFTFSGCTSPQGACVGSEWLTSARSLFNTQPQLRSVGSTEVIRTLSPSFAKHITGCSGFNSPPVGGDTPRLCQSGVSLVV